MQQQSNNRIQSILYSWEIALGLSNKRISGSKQKFLALKKFKGTYSPISTDRNEDIVAKETAWSLSKNKKLKAYSLTLKANVVQEKKISEKL